jgi:biotin carboxyl carrier protein
MKTYTLTIDGETFKTKIVEYKGTTAIISINGNEYEVEIEHEKKDTTPMLIRSSRSSSSSDTVATPKTPVAKAGDVISPIPGQIKSILVKEGDSVSEGDPVIILEAMKMESEITSPTSGKIEKILVQEGVNVDEGQVMIRIGE